MSSATGNGPLEVNGIQNQCRETELQLDIGPVDSEDLLTLLFASAYPRSETVEETGREAERSQTSIAFS